MIPENVGRFTTEGERQVYRFFEMVAKPDPDSSIRGRATLNSYGQGICVEKTLVFGAYSTSFGVKKGGLRKMRNRRIIISIDQLRERPPEDYGRP